APDHCAELALSNRRSSPSAYPRAELPSRPTPHASPVGEELLSQTVVIDLCPTLKGCRMPIRSAPCLRPSRRRATVRCPVIREPKKRGIPATSQLPVEKGRSSMPTFMCFLNWTDQGAKAIKDGPKRYEAT